MERIGKYDIIEELGRGGMGVVYKAYDPVIGRNVAIKVIIERALTIPDIRERFYREARSAGRLSHENIVIIHDVGEADGFPYIVMEYLPGIDLRQAMDGQILLTLEQKLDLAIQICHGLHFAHEHQIIHRDIKPENIRIVDSTRVKIVDFGIARLGTDSLTVTQGSIGTPRYMSPEQIRGEKIDHRADIFSFGVLLYELISGQNPFAGDKITTVIYRILHEEPAPIDLQDEAFGQALFKVLARCLEKDPNKRYQDCLSVAHDLEIIRAEWEEAFATAAYQHTLTQADSPTFGARLPTLRSKTGSTKQKSKISAVLPEKKRSFRRIGIGAAILIVLATVGYATFQAVTNPTDVTSNTTSTVQLPHESDALDALRELAEEERQLMITERERADELNARTQASDLYEDGQENENIAQTAFTEGGADGYRRAREAFILAKNYYRDAAMQAGRNNETALNDQARQIQRNMDRVRDEVSPRRSDDLVDELFDEAEQLRNMGNQHLNNNRPAEAVRSFSAAEDKYREARSLILELITREKRAADLARNDLGELLRSAVEKNERQRLQNSIQRAESLRSSGIEAYDAGNYRLAAETFNSAHSLLSTALETLEDAERETAQLKKAADQARRVTLTAKNRIPSRYTNTPDYNEALQVERRANQAYENRDFSEAARLYANSENLFLRAASPSVIIPMETRQILDGLTQAITRNRWDALPRIVTAHYRAKVATIERTFIISRVTTLSDQFTIDENTDTASMFVTVNVHYRQRGSDLERGFPIESRWLWARVDGVPVLERIE